MSWAEGNSVFGGADQEFGVEALSNTGICFFLREVKDFPGGDIVLYGYTWTVANCTGTFARANASTIAWDI
jgi:hypothetical protein